jgi:hypothetical protein
MKILTNFFFLLLFTLGMSLSLQAQQRNYTVEISSPGSIAGTYFAVPGGFGTQDYCSDGPLSGEWAIVTDAAGGTLACDPVTSDMTGKIALVDRGVCNFSQKCFNAQEAGAIAVIVCNNVFDPETITMAAGNFGDQVTVPCFMMSKAQCDIIRTNMPAQVTITPNYPVDNSTDIVVWGNNPGEGDFDGGLNDWTLNNISCGPNAATVDLWNWSTDGSANGAYGGGFIGSVSACNGAMVFNSDALDNDTIQGNFGFGPCATVQVGELISPVIDLSGVTSAGVSLRFNQCLRQFQSNYFVEWTTDGVNWTSTQINTQYPVNSDIINEVVRVPMPGVVGSSTLQVRFRLEGNYYYWIVDDVKIIEQEAFNLRVNDNFVAVPPNAMWPAGQKDAVNFLADVENIGALGQDNVNLNVQISEDASGDIIFISDLDYGTIDGNTLVENEIFPENWVPSGTEPIGAYTGVYTISSDEDDFNPSDNTYTFNFMITDSTFSKELGRTRNVLPAAGNWQAGEPHSWAYGNCFFYTAQTGNGQLSATSASFTVANAAAVAGRSLVIALYEWNDGNADGIMQVGERTRRSLTTYIIDGSEVDTDIITVDLPAFPNFETYHVLEPGKYYVLMVEYITEDVQDFVMAASEQFDYSATVFASIEQGAPRYAGILGIAGSLEDADYVSVGFGRDIVPVVRLHTRLLTNTFEPMAPNNKVLLMPNPVSDMLTVDISLERPSGEVVLYITDVTGRIISVNKYKQVQQQQMQLNVSNLASGTYMLVVATDSGTEVKRFVVQH